MILCVAPSPAIDRTLVVDALTVGEIHRPHTVVAVAGGKGLNVARTASALGADVAAVAPLAGHAGRWIAGELAAEGVALTPVWTAGETRTCVSVAADGLTEFYETASPMSADDWAALVEVVAATRADWVTISGSLPPGADLPALIGAAHSAGAKVALDTHGPALVQGLAAGPDVVKVNRAEANGRSAADLRAGAGGDGHAAIVTDGTRGLTATSPDGQTVTLGGSSVGHFPQGSGDALLAGLVTALDRGAGWDDALAAGIDAAEANAQHPGAARLAPVLPLLVLAFDHRTSLVRGLFDGDADAAAARAPAAKRIVLDGLLAALADDPHAGRYRPGVLVDAQYGAEVARAARDNGLVLSMAIERSGQAEIALEHGVAELRAFAPDYVKALVRFNADDDSAARARQLDTLRGLSAELQDAGLRLMFELLVPPLPGQLVAVDGDRGRFDRELRPALTIRAIEAIRAAGIAVDLWKLEGIDGSGDAAAVAAAAAPAPCLILGRGADRAAVDRWLAIAAPLPGFGGFAIGRSIWWDALRGWLNGTTDRDDAAAAIAAAYRGFVATYLRPPPTSIPSGMVPRHGGDQRRAP